MQNSIGLIQPVSPWPFGCKALLISKNVYYHTYRVKVIFQIGRNDLMIFISENPVKLAPKS